jgi:ribonuclease R
VVKLTRYGYGFVQTPDGQYFVLPSGVHGAMDGDLVEIVRLRSQEQRGRNAAAKASGGGQGGGQGASGAGSSGNRGGASNRGGWSDSGGMSSLSEKNRESLGAVRRVIDRAQQTVIGTLIEKDGLRVVRPQDERISFDIFIDPYAVSKSAQDGDVVVVRLTTYPTKYESAAGYIEDVLGAADDRGVDFEVILRLNNIRTVFPAAALEEARALADGHALADAHALAAGQALPTLARRDLRDTLIFTIDPPDAKDFDDALSADYVDGRLVLGVHIADVSAYVPWDSSLDVEARARATSVYLPDRVVPMLPPELSDELCSLKAHEDRLAFTVRMEMNNDGSVAAVEFFPSLIRSAARLTYDQVDAYLSAAEASDSVDISEPIRERLSILDKLARKLHRRRLARGAIDFAGAEAKVTLDEEGHPIAVRLRQSTAATSLVEEAMILANEQVAAYMLKLKAPMVYRIHEDPIPKSLKEATHLLGILAPTDSAGVQALLDAHHGQADYPVVSMLMLRAMQRARYAPHFTLHFGMASPAYCHFTSPIRRYPDLLVHQLLKWRLANQRPPKALFNQLETLCVHLSECERAAEAATSQATRLKLVEYLGERSGELFDCLVIGINVHGLVLREVSTTATGFLKKESLPVGMIYETDERRFADPDDGRHIRLGQSLRVCLDYIDLNLPEAYFKLA